MLKESLKYITIGQLLTKNQISVRTANCCHNAGFISLYDIITYFEHGGSFLTIRNAGKLTCEELKNLCDNYLSNLSDYNMQSVENKRLLADRKSEGELLYESLSTNQRLLIEQKYSELLSHCSVRTFNGLRKFTANEFIESYLFCDSHELMSIKNIGKKSLTEIFEFRSELKVFIEKIKHIDDSPLECIKLKTVNKYGDFCTNDFIIKFYEKHSHLPMFWILEQDILNDKSKEIEILRDSFQIIQNHRLLSKQEIAQKFNLTRERVRQIRSNLFHNTLRIPAILIKNKENCHDIEGPFRFKEDWQYIISSVSTADILHTGSAEIQNHLKEEKSTFSIEFCLHIISFIFQDIYFLLGGIDVPKKDRIWEYTFLVKKELSNIFDFNKFREEFSNFLIDNDEDILLSLENYVANSRCWINYEFDKTDRIVSILREILLYEFHLYSDEIDGNIKIPANKEKKPMTVIYEILQQNGKPMHLNDIFLEFKNIFPGHKYIEAAQLRPYLQKHEAISYRNRKSVYTLKEWEHIKTGTIRDTIVEFLSKNDLPQTAEDITEYVLQYFPETNISSVKSSMSIDRQGRFSIYKDNLFGLTSKEYPTKFEIQEFAETQRKSFSQRIYDFEKFIIENDHFPFSSSADKNEESLCRWWRLVIKGITQISNEQKIIVERILKQYSEYETDKSNYEWNLNFNKLKCFLLENRRIPSARSDERYLYGWFRRAKKDFQNYNLTEEQRKKYIDLAKLI